MNPTKEYLLANGFEVLAGPYKMPDEDRMFSSVMKDMARGGILHAALWSEDRDTVEVWQVPRVKNVTDDKP